MVIKEAHQDQMQMFITIHLREVAAGNSGKKFGDHMETPSLEDQKELDQTGTRDDRFMLLGSGNFQTIIAARTLWNDGFVQEAQE